MTSECRPRAYSYIRFSTPEQERGDSLRRQAEAAAVYAAAHDLDLVDHSYKDLGISAYHGTNAETGMLSEFIDAVRAGIIPKGSYLLIESMDRLSRAKPRKALRLLESICDEGITVVTLGDGKSYDEETLNEDPMAFMWAFMVAMRANEESATKSRRLRSAWASKRASASERILTSKCPSWLKVCGQAPNRSFEIIESNAAVVRRIYEMALAGIGQNRIAETLNTEHVPAFNGGTMWHRSFVMRLLRSPTVVGTYTPHILDPTEKSRKNRRPIGQVDHYYPPIIDRSTFVEVQTLRAAKARCGNQVAKATTRNVLAGLGRCVICGGAISMVSKTTRYRYLVCSKALSGAGCSYISVRHELVANALMRDGPHWRPGKKITLQHDEPHGTETAARNLAAAAASLQNLVAAIESGIGSTALWDQMRRAEAAKEDANAAFERQKIAGGNITDEMVSSRLKRLKTARHAGDIGAVNASLRVLLDHVTVNPGRRSLQLHWRHGPVTEARYRMHLPKTQA